MIILVVGLVLFLGIHSVSIFAHDWRTDRVNKLGEQKWKNLYSLVSLAGLVLIVWGYAIADDNPVWLYQLPYWMSHVTALLMLFALILLVQMNMPAGKIKAAVKHPGVTAVKIWAFAHLLVNGDLASVLLFGSFLAWAVMDRISLKRRGAPNPVAGPVKWDILSIVVGLVLYGLFVWKLHYWLFGVMPVVAG